MTDGQHVNDMIAVMARSYPRLQTRAKSRMKKSKRAKKATISSIFDEPGIESCRCRGHWATNLDVQPPKKIAGRIHREVNTLTKQDLAEVAAQMLKSNPTLCLSGDIAGAARFETVKAMF